MQKWQYAQVIQARGYGGTMFGGSAKDWVITRVSDVLSKYYLDKDDVVLNIADRAGQDGWEIISVVPQSGIGGSESAGFTSERVFYFKRPISET